MSLMRKQAAVDTLENAIAAIAANVPGRLGVAVRFLQEGIEVGYAADDLFPSASVIKIPIMIEVYRQVAAGTLSLDELLPVLKEEITDGSGLLQYLHVGLPLNVADALELMIAISDNTATNLLVRRVGAEAINTTMQNLGLSQTRSAGAIRIANTPAGLVRPSHTTPREMALLLAAIAEGRLINADASAAMARTLEHQVYADMLPRYLPFTYYPERLGLAEMPIRVAHKTGALSGVRNDVGIVSVRTAAGARTMIISAFTAELADEEVWTAENIGVLAIARVARLAYDTLVRLAEEVE